MNGSLLKELRKQAGLTQSELGDKLGVIKQTISNWENGVSSPGNDTLTSIANILGVSTDYLLGVCNDPIESVEWRYPHIENRLGKILQEYRKKESVSVQEFAKSLDITVELVNQLELGIYVPSLELLKKIVSVTGYELDYLTGAENISMKSKKSFNLSGNSVEVFDFESNYCFQSHFEELCIKNNITVDNCEDKLQLSVTDFNNIRFNRMPTLSEILRISYAFNVSIDYLIGKTDIPLVNISNDELELILNYRDCIDAYKENIRKRAYELSIETLKDISAVADKPLKKTGTTN